MITPNQFRRWALELPDAVESAHMEHPDFRVGRRIFASLGYPDARWAVVMLSPEDQKRFCTAEPNAFVPVKGGWGRNGSTQVELKEAKQTSVLAALQAAYDERVRKNGKSSHAGAKAQRLRR